MVNVSRTWPLIRLRVGAKLAASQQFDIDSLEQHAATLERYASELGSIDIVLFAPSTLPDQAACQNDPSIAVRDFNTNAVSVIVTDADCQCAGGAKAPHPSGDLFGCRGSRAAVELSVR